MIVRLEALAAELAARGWSASVHAAGGREPSLHVRNPHPGAAALSEHVYVPQQRLLARHHRTPGHPVARAARRTGQIAVMAGGRFRDQDGSRSLAAAKWRGGCPVRVPGERGFHDGCDFGG